ncbi:MAG: hypothetical protein HZA81_01475 [Candidatus Taylorbacteria bacterium]|nr:hypothetical protein [Candidatus Taylorbacteria bacterium]
MKKFGIVASVLAFPYLAFAQVSGNVSNLDGIFRFIKRLLDTVLPLIIALTVVWFVWGLFRMFTASDEEKKEKAKSTIIYGVIALFVMISIWGLVNILYNTFQLDSTNRSNQVQQQLPNLPS